MRNHLEALLGGQFICRQASPVLHEDLLNDRSGVRGQVEQVLETLGRELRSTGEGEDITFYAAYRSAEREDDRASVRQQFKEILDEIEPMVGFLSLVMKVSGGEASLAPGETIRFHELLARIESEAAYRDRLQDLARSRMFSRMAKRKTTKDRLTVVLEELVNRGYLVIGNRESSLYVTTGKIDYYYRTLEFLQEHAGIQVIEDETDADQQEMAL